MNEPFVLWFCGLAPVLVLAALWYGLRSENHGVSDALAEARPLAEAVAAELATRAPEPSKVAYRDREWVIELDERIAPRGARLFVSAKGATIVRAEATDAIASTDPARIAAWTRERGVWLDELADAHAGAGVSARRA